MMLLGIGLLTVARVARNPKLRGELLEALARRFPIEQLLDEIALEVEAAKAAVNDEAAADRQAPGPPDREPDTSDREPDTSDREPDTSDPEPARKGSGRPRGRRPVNRRRGDTNGQRGRTPPNQGKRAA